MAAAKRGAARGPGAGSGSNDMPRVLVVCRRNVRRSPAVAALLRAGGLDGFTITSAGTEALVGDGFDMTMLAELRGRGLAVPTHRARLLTPREIEGADLILTLERAHRTAVVRMVPAAVRRTFTLAEIGALIALADPAQTASASGAPQRLEVLLAQMPMLRALRQRRRPSDDDIADVRRPTPHATRELASVLDTAVRPLLAALAPGATGAPGSAGSAADADGSAQAASSERSSIHHLRSAATNASAQQIKSAR
ncbi:hypothetical protein [Nocardioides sp.]|uniref:arsenate reductase/protein-tyrosine-phosphatase family protein n=1 Tax=Nocardioides sp. TaxID=35761 RepID=UPI00260DD47C|nr:hypothetical protein [Nocardioides sp.]